MLTLIDDGQVFSNHIDAEPGFHHGITYKFRPVGNAELAQLKHDLNSLEDVAALERAHRFLIEHLTEWDQQDANGKPLPITLENVNRMRPMLPTQIIQAVMANRSTESIGDSVKN